MQKFLKEMGIEMLQSTILYIKAHPVSQELDQQVIHILNQKTLEVIRDK